MSIKQPSMLAFERKLETSDALMLSGKWNNQQSIEGWEKIEITKRYNRSTQSAYGTSENNKVSPNPVSSGSDDANLPLEHDTLKVNFSMRVVGNLASPFGCNSPEFSKAIVEKVNEFKSNGGAKALAFRYAYNIANGRFLWRNRVGAEEIVIRVKAGSDEFTFSAYDFSLKDFEKSKENEALIQLSQKIEEGLLGDSESFLLVEVNAFVKLGVLQHVFPSQKMNVGEKEKVLFQLDGCAALHNVKVGNAIRTIDTWYPRYDEHGYPIAIEPFGAVTQIGEAFRKNKKEGDLYSSMLDWVNNKEVSFEQQAYIVANLIRGGVFGGKN